MSYIYSIPDGYPTSAVRLYRFPYKGERDSARINLLLQAIVGDLKLCGKFLSDSEDLTTENIGGLFMTVHQEGFIEG